MSDFYIYLQEDEGLSETQIEKLTEDQLNEFFKKYIKKYKLKTNESDT